jgi:hypothetical protein
MEPVLTSEQIAKARELRADGATYPEIAAAVGFTGDADLIRGHCLDIAPANGRKPRKDKPVRKRADGKGTIRAFTAEEDRKIREWLELGEDKGSTNAFAKSIGRAPHSVTARIKTLARRGKISAE